MSVKILNFSQKETIRHQHNYEDRSKKQLSQMWGVSVRTIERVLNEGVVAVDAILIHDAEYKKMKKIMKTFNIQSPEQLNQRLTDAFNGQSVLGFDDPKPKAELTMEEVQVYLNSCTVQQLAGLFYSSGLIKIAEMHNGSVMNATQRFTEAAKKAKPYYGPAQRYKTGY